MFPVCAVDVRKGLYEHNTTSLCDLGSTQPLGVARLTNNNHQQYGSQLAQDSQSLFSLIQDNNDRTLT